MAFAALLAAVALATGAPVAPGDPSGDYVFEGSCPTIAPPYRGTLTIRREGAFHLLSFAIDGTTLSGRGLMTGRRMAVEFRASNGGGGLMQMRRRGRTWRGSWAFFNQQEICRESWTPAPHIGDSY
jgi:hypothetical protein